MARPTGRPIRDELLDAARALAQGRGVAEFSYADLANDVGIRAASIHHHFPKKEDLLSEVARRYRQSFSEALISLDARPTAADRLAGYRDLFRIAAAEGNMCLCGSAAAEWSSVGDTTRMEVGRFFDEQRTWLAKTLAFGQAMQEFNSRVDPDADAPLLLSSLEGALLLTRANGADDALDSAFDRFMALALV